MRTLDKIFLLIDKQEYKQEVLYENYFINNKSIRQIIREFKKSDSINKYTIAKYINLNVQVPKFMISIFSGYFDDVEDRENLYNFVLGMIDKSYVLAKSYFRIGRTPIKIKKVFSEWMDRGLPLADLPVFLGFVMLLKNHNVCVSVNKEAWDEYAKHHNIDRKMYYDYLKLLNDWVDAGMLKEITTSTKSTRYMIINYASIRYNVLKYYTRFIEYCLLDEDFKVYFDRLYRKLDYGIKMRIIFMYVYNAFKTDDINEMLDILLSDSSIDLDKTYSFRRLLFEYIMESISDENINEFVRYKFKLSFTKK
jgi:hypothetical protein